MTAPVRSIRSAKLRAARQQIPPPFVIDLGRPARLGEARKALVGVTTRAVPRFTLSWTNHERRSAGRLQQKQPSRRRPSHSRRYKRIKLKLRILVRRRYAGIADKHDFVPATQPQRRAWEHRFWERIMGTEFGASGVLIGPSRHVPTNERLREPFKVSWKAASRTCAPTSRSSARQLHDGRSANRGAGTTCHRTPWSAFLIRPM
jgi:hypothetical protein